MERLKNIFRRFVIYSLILTVPVLLFFGYNETIAPGYTYRFWITIDVLANVILWGDTETISKRLGELEARGNESAALFCDGLDIVFQDPDHCLKATR